MALHGAQPSVLGLRPDAAPAPASTAPPLPFRLLERYRVERKIGQGGMGVVYVAHDTKLGRPVVLKQLLIAEPEHVVRLTREGQILAQLNHPHILKLYAVEVEGGMPVLVLELLDGVTLRAELEVAGAFPRERAIAVADMIADALEPVHGVGLVHRDLKPENVLLTAGGGLKVLDFGLARLADRAADDAALTQPGTYVGTPTYMSPEVWRSEPLDGRADLYALGVLLFELLAGKPPFDAPTVTALAVAHLTDPPPHLLEVAPAAGPALADLVDRLLAKKPADRPPDATTVRKLLAACRVTPRATGEQPVPDRVPARSGPAKRGSRPPVPSAPASDSASPRSSPKSPASAPSSRGMTRPRHAASLALGVAALLGVGAVLGLALRFRRSGGPGGEPARIGVSEMAVTYAGPRRLAIRFRTTEPSRWTVRIPDGASVTDPEAATHHALELPVSPWDAPDALEVSCEGRRVTARPPPAARARIRRLSAAVRAARLDLELTDGIYNVIRRSLRDWNTVDPTTATAANAAAQVRERPEIAMPLMHAITAAREAVAELEPVRELVTETLTAKDAPATVQEELLDALARLDHLDALAAFFGQPAPAGVQALLAPVFGLEVKKLPPRRGPGAALAAPPAAPGCTAFAPKSGDGLALFVPSEDITSANMGLAPLLALNRIPGLANFDIGSRLDLTPCCAAGPRGWRVVFHLTSFPAGLYLWLQLPGRTAAAPLRLEPAQDKGVNTELAVTARLPAALFASGTSWRLTQRRLFLNASRTYVAVRRVDVYPD